MNKYANYFLLHFLLVLLSNMFIATTITTAFASTSNIPLANIEPSQDQASLQRGAKVYYEVCRLCHSMKFIKYKVLEEIGFTNKQIDALRDGKPKGASLEKTMSDDTLISLYGLVPPDLSLMAKARKHGPQFIYTLLTSYSEKQGIYENALLPGIKMPDILNIALVIDEKRKQQILGQARDVTEFLVWSADPRAAVRKTIGSYVITYFIILSAMLFFIMKRVWSRLDK